ncbi:hypothetical protein CRM22_010887, partial [Opisthorchis felineus]
FSERQSWLSDGFARCENLASAICLQSTVPFGNGRWWSGKQHATSTSFDA